jgi:hypothetical protein
LKLEIIEQVLYSYLLLHKKQPKISNLKIIIINSHCFYRTGILRKDSRTVFQNATRLKTSTGRLELRDRNHQKAHFPHISARCCSGLVETIAGTVSWKAHRQTLHVT